MTTSPSNPSQELRDAIYRVLVPDILKPNRQPDLTDPIGICVDPIIATVLQTVREGVEFEIEAARIDGMFTEWNGLNIADIDMVKSKVTNLLNRIEGKG